MPHTTFKAEARHLAYDQTEGAGPGIVFLSGFNSTKEGTKALHLEAWAKQRGRAFLRFDYSGHGASSGSFLDGSITRWSEDAEAIIRGLTQGPQVLVGSSMGGWIALLLARRMADRIAGLVTVAAAPDFTEDRYWRRFDESDRSKLECEG
ncbi:MAG: alpha/beta hydrolase, partial [Pseudomonadota bacterium]